MSRRTLRLTGWTGGLAALLAGVAQTLSFAPFEQWWLQVLSVGVLVALLAGAPPRTAAVRAWAFGAGWLGTGFWWIYISLHVYGFLPAWLSALAVAVLAALLSLYYAVAAALWARLRRGRAGVDALSFAACWLLAELARASFFTGFPWIAGGYAHTTGPLAAWAPWIGVYGLGALSAWLAAALALAVREAIDERRRVGRSGARALAGLAVPALLLAAGAVLPQDFTRSTGFLTVSLMQTDVPQDQKFDDAHINAAIDWHLQRFATAPGRLVLTPETSLPVLPAQLPAAVWQSLERPFEAPGRALLVGIFTGDDEHGYTNTVFGLDATHRVDDDSNYHYGKRHLLPFGEFVPPGFQWMIDMMKVPIGSQARGTVTAPFVAAGQRIRPLVCYEDLFGEDFASAMVGPDAATLMANVTNLAWFGRFMIQDQHLQFSRMRALEFQRGQVRATNTGATAVIDWHGVVTDRLPPEIEGELDARVEGRTGDTPYGRWLARGGLWPLWGAGVAVLLAALAVRTR